MGQCCLWRLWRPSCGSSPIALPASGISAPRASTTYVNPWPPLANPWWFVLAVPWRCWSLPVSAFVSRAFVATWKPAMVQQRPTSRQVHPGRIHLWSHSMAGLGMSFSILSYLDRCKKPSCWQSSTESSTTSTDRIRLSRGVRPWKFSSNGKRPNHPPALLRTGAAKGVTSYA